MKKNFGFLSLVLFICLVLFACKKKGNSPENVNSTKNLAIKGVDLSLLPEIRTSGLTIKNAANESEDMLLTLKKNGVNVIRLRIWNHPSESTSALATVKTLADEIHAMGMKVLLTVHYSDSWADPSQQTKPAAWQALSFSALKDSVFAFTTQIMQEIHPEYIQIGNEINNGLLWPEGNFSNLTQFKALLQKGIEAVRASSNSTQIVLHYAGHSNANSFFNSLQGLDYDIIGLSYYPIWHGKSLDSLKANLNTISTTQNKPIFIAETAYPFTFGYNDWTNNIIGLNSQILPEFAATESGQQMYLAKLRSIVEDVPKAIGFCYWGGEWISYKGATASNGSAVENQALWNFENKALPVQEVYK
jgi:arabinogalactan endo-1,4-beta-galactosidase